jgi:DNA-binding transcriptional ArsR family regulator
MKKQLSTLVIQNPEAIKTLRETQFLGYFLEPRSPSEVALQAKISANLMHHHAKRFLELGLVFEAKREDGKVFYQLAAKNFKIPWEQIPPDDLIGGTLRDLSSAFSSAYERSDRLSSESPEFHMIGFAEPSEVDQPRSKSNAENLEARPAHYQMRSIRMTSSRYRALVKQISDLLTDAEMESSSDATQCTIALLGFEGGVADVPSDSHHVLSYLPEIRIHPD